MADTPGAVLITGGSRGIGRATALGAARQGRAVAVNYRRDRETADRTVAEINAGGGRAVALPGDVTDEADVAGMFDAAASALGPLGAVVVNAGIVAPAAPLARMEAARLRRVIDTNLFGALLTAREAARRLPRPADAPSAAIVFVSSAASRLGAPFEYVDYAASKGAIDTLTLGLAKELAGDNIRVNAVRPGIIETGIHAATGDPDRAARLGAGVPMGRPGTADEVAAAILWLLSDAAAYTTGAILDVTGGR